MPMTMPTLTWGSTYVCPVDGCDWTHTPEPLVTPDTSALDDVFGMPRGAFGQQAMHNWRVQIERDLRKHCDGHTSVEWLATVVRLMAELGQSPTHPNGGGV